MNEADEAPSPDAFEVTVDGIEFSVVYDPRRPGTYNYTRRTHPAYGYGFDGRRSDHQRSTKEQHIAAIRDFLSQCDPVTGYLDEDESND